MAARKCYRIQPAGTELAGGCSTGACDSGACEFSQGGCGVFKLLDDLWEAVLLSRQRQWQPEIVEIECPDRCPAPFEPKASAAVEGDANGPGEQRADANGPESTARITRRRQFESWDEILDLAWRVYRGTPTAADRELLGWTLPAVVLATFYDYRPCWPIRPQSVEWWMNRLMDCMACHRKHTRAAGCNQAVLDAIDRARTTERDPAPIDQGRSFHDRLVDAELLRRLCDEEEDVIGTLPRDLCRSRSRAKSCRAPFPSLPR